MENIKMRLLTGWNWVRVMYTGIGLYVAVQTGMNSEWPGVLFGIYFASMGLFAFGCASGNCYGRSCTVESAEKEK